jgi:hypothetical protein
LSVKGSVDGVAGEFSEEALRSSALNKPKIRNSRAIEIDLIITPP